MKVSHHIILLSVVCFIGLMQSTNIYAQETTTRESELSSYNSFNPNTIKKN